MGAKQPKIPPLIGWLYDLVLWSFSVLIDLFFREVHPRGSWKIPRRGPVIIVAAPHANQVWMRIFCLSLCCITAGGANPIIEDHLLTVTSVHSLSIH